MVHDVSKQYSDQIATLTIRSRARSSRSNAFLAPTYAEITKLGALGGPKGVRVKIRDVVTEHRLGTLNIVGEDLYALREFLAELPEEAFVRPADPVEKPERWTKDDVVQEISGDATYTYVRGPLTWSFGHIGGTSSCSDEAVSRLVDGKCTTQARILRQASGQDL